MSRSPVNHLGPDRRPAPVTTEGVGPFLVGFCFGIAGLVSLIVLSATARSLLGVMALGLLLPAPILFLLSGSLSSRVPGSAAFYAVCFAIFPLGNVLYLSSSGSRAGPPIGAIVMGGVIILQSLAIYAGMRAAREKRRAEAEAAAGLSCPACGYPFEGLGPVGACPECGRPFKRDADLV